MAENEQAKTNGVRTVSRIPMTLATAFAVMIALLPSFFFGKWNFTVWACFVVWAEYFALGARPGTIKTIFPCFLAGSANAAVYMLTSFFLERVSANIFGPSDLIYYLAWCVSTLIWTPALIIPLEKFHWIQKGSLPYFNGFAMVFAVVFTSSVPQVGPVDNIYILTVVGFLWVNLMGLFGWLIGYLNIALTFPKTVPDRSAD